MRETKNYYQVLGLSRGASEEEIKTAYRIYAGKFHPDKHKGDLFFEERFKEVKVAYEILSDSALRREYDIKTFGKSKVKKETSNADFDRPGENARKTKPRRKFNIDMSHLDLYLAAFYSINLVAWVILKKISEDTTPGAIAWGLFLALLSSLVFWLFINGLISAVSRRSPVSRIYLCGCLLATLVLTYVLIWTTWTP